MADENELDQIRSEFNELEKYISDLWEFFPTPLLYVNMQARIMDIDNAVTSLLGYDKEEIIGKKLETIVKTREDAALIHEQTLSTGSTKEKQITVLKKSGETSDVSISTSSRKDSDGNAIGYFASLIDLTYINSINVLLKIQRDLAVKLGSLTDLKDVLKICVDAAIEASGMDSGGIYLVSDDKNSLILEYSTGLSAGFIKNVARFDRDSNNMKMVMKGKPLYSQYKEIPVPLSTENLDEGLKVLAAVPIINNGEVIASFNIASHKNSEISPFARLALETISSQIGESLERIKSDTSVRQKISELEEFHSLSVGRELKMMELEHEVNGLLKELGRPPKYKP